MIILIQRDYQIKTGQHEVLKSWTGKKWEEKKKIDDAISETKHNCKVLATGLGQFYVICTSVLWWNSF